MDIVFAAIKAMAEANGAAPAVISGGRTISYAEMLRLTSMIANHLADRGAKPGNKVLLNFADLDLRLIVTVACLHCGLIPFAVADVARLSGELDQDFVIGAGKPLFPSIPCNIVLDQALIDEAADAEVRDFGTRRDDDIYFVTTTTGTTGRPKLVAELFGAFKRRSRDRHGMLYEPGLAGLQGGRYAIGHRVMVTIGDSSKYGFGTGLWLLAHGATAVRAAREPLERLKAIELFGVTDLNTTPSTIEEMLQFMEPRELRFPTVKRIRLSGSLFQPELLERIERSFDADVEISYGAAEVGGISSGLIRSETFRLGYVGEINHGVKLVNAGTEERPGALTIIADASLLATYYSKGKLIRHQLPFYTLPDFGYVKGTSLYVVGREDEVFNWSGNKTAFSLLESAVRAIPGVRDAGFVGGIAAGEPTELLVGLVANPDVEPASVIAVLCRVLKSTMAAPHLHLIPLKTIPRNSNGKVDRQKIVQAYRLTQASAL